MTRDRLVITASPHLKGKDSTPRIMWNVVGSLVLVTLFVFQQRRAPEPILDLSLVTRQPFLVANIFNVLTGAYTPDGGEFDAAPRAIHDVSGPPSGPWGTASQLRGAKRWCPKSLSIRGP